jgi:Protein of unknown function (DUF669).
MPIVNPDTSAAADMGPIEPGTYPAKITEVEYKTSKSSGNPMIVPKFEIQVGDGKARTRQAYLVITGEGAFNFDQLLRATGFEDLADQFKAKDGPKPDFDTDELIGQELMVVIESDTYNGQLRDKIRSYLRA